MNTQTMTLDVSKQPRVAPTLHLGQGDKNGTTLAATIYDNGIPLTLTGKSVKLCIRTPNGAGYYEASGTVSGSVATFTIDETYAGSVYGVTDIAYVEVISGSTVVCSTNRFRVVVLPSATEDADPSGAYTNGVKEFLDEAESRLDNAIQDAQTDIAEAVEESDSASARAIAAAEAAEGIILGDIPTMTPLIKGGAKLGSGLSVEDDALSLGNLVESGSGDSVETDGCALFSVEGEGWAQQDSTTGKNLLPNNATSQTINGVTFTVNTDGSVTVNGTNSTDTILLYVIGRCALTEGSAYTLSGCPTNGGTTTAFLQLAGYGDDVGNGYSITARANALTPNAQIRIAANATVSNLTFYPMLEPGDTKTSYEPYTGGAPSPSPDYPQEIRVCRGRNLLDRMASTLGYYINDAGEVKSSSGAEITDYIAVAPGNYVIRFLEHTSGNLRVHGYSADKQTVTLLGKVNPGAGNYGTLAVEVTSSIAWLRASYSADSEEVQLELGTTPTPYVPYGHIGLEVQGRNLLDERVYSVSGKYLISDGSESTSSSWKISEYIEIEPGNQYTLTIGAGSAPSYALYDTSKTLISAAAYNGSASITFTAPSNAAYIRMSYRTDYQFQLERGSTAHAYEPYHHTTTPIPLPLRSDGECWAAGLPDGTADSLALDSAGHVEWGLAVDEITLDETSITTTIPTYPNQSSTMVWATVNNYLSNRMSIHALISPTDGSWGLCSHAATADYSTFRATDSPLAAIVNGAKQPAIRLPVSCGTTLEDAQTWLSTHPITMLYQLATPTTSDGGYIDLPELPAGAVCSIPELESIGVSWWVYGAEKAVEHGLNERKRTMYEIEQLEDAIADLATAVAALGE